MRLRLRWKKIFSNLRQKRCEDPDRIKWELNKWQNRFMTKKDGVSANSRIVSNLREKKMKVHQTLEQDGERKKWVWNKQQNRVLTKKDGV